MTMSTYNGWANHSTWNFMNWHGDQLDAYAEKFAAYFVEISTQEVADDIEVWAWEETGLNEMPIGFVRDAASREYNKVAWMDLAERVKHLATQYLEPSMSNTQARIVWKDLY